jgi:hypothetical protein
MTTDQLYTIEDYYDGPREGFATFEGHPHHYKCVVDESAVDGPESFRLTPIAPEVLPLVLEAWQIWLRWKGAFEAGRTTIDSHPAVPDDKPRQEYLQSVISQCVLSNQSRSFLARAEFQPGLSGVTWHVADA